MSFPLITNSEPTPMMVTLLRGRSGGRGKRSRIRLAALQVPLVVKLTGANLSVVALIAVICSVTGEHSSLAFYSMIAAVVVLHGVAVYVALRPIRDLEGVASRIWHGDFGARVEQSPLADSEVLRIGSMFNILLDGLVSDRARMRALATEVIEVGDRERAALARELHDSTAQRVAALLLQISAAARDCSDPSLAKRLEAARDTAQELTEEVRTLAQTVHPRVLDDLGLVAALRKLGRDASHGTGIDVDVNAPTAAGQLPHATAAVLYRVAQEATRNAIRHAQPKHVHITIELDEKIASLEVRDDGKGFNLAAAEQERHGMGLMTMRERLALVDGWLEVRTAEGGGTSVVASIPLVTPTNSIR
jgi:signal transduction histidine kinase